MKHLTITTLISVGMGLTMTAFAETKAHTDFETRMETTKEIHLMKEISEMDLTPAERKAMEFLYAYMPVSDMVDRSPEFYLRNVRTALAAREEMPWGKKVPDREWFHFVLPTRVNNENLDLFRPDYYEELKERVEGMTMEEAILETNHWLHEKATYRPSDSRTSSPTSTISQAIGRCGEESTLGVAAMRAIGIPARQVYTPRWAHTDDNHAWVEVWCDGKWHFLGACEPEPVLDLAWFNAPASRGMMMHTNVFGNYDGPEEVITRDEISTRINVTSNYAPVREVKAKIKDMEGNVVEGADVSFCIYNYAEYYPATTKQSDSDGLASTTAGQGDMVVWATDGRRFGFSKAAADETSPAEVVLEYAPHSSATREIDIFPPKGRGNLPEVSNEMRMENDRRFSAEDSIRRVYTSTFANETDARHAAARLGVDGDKLAKILMESRGNHANILSTLTNMQSDRRWLAVDLLQAVSEKDRRDIGMEVVTDNALNIPIRTVYDRETYISYVLNPRIEKEELTPWRSYLTQQLKQIPKSAKRDAESLALWIGNNISINEGYNPQRLRVSPRAVWERREGNRISRDILYVAMARTLGFATRIDEVTGNVQTKIPGGDWRKVSFGRDMGDVTSMAKYGKLHLIFTPDKNIVDPKYYSAFSISKIESGKARQLEYPEDATWSNTFGDSVDLEEGQYILTTGQRLANGGVLAESRIFTIEPEMTTTVPLNVREDETQLKVIGTLDAETLYKPFPAEEKRSILSTTGRGYYTVVLILPGHEPSAHVLNDLSLKRDEIEKDGRTILALFANEDDANRFAYDHFDNLPDNLVFGIDADGVVKSQLKESLHLESDEMPMTAVADTFNRVVYCQQGYSIGSGETILQTLRKLDRE